MIDVRVTRITWQAPGIHSFELKPLAGVLPAFTAGAHVEVLLPNGMRRPYSLHNGPGETHRYEIAVQREDSGRGGSRSLHDGVRVGDTVTIAPPANCFALNEGATRHVLIGGGIGVTPLLAMAHRLRELGADFCLHYCGRSLERMAFLDEAKTLVAPADLVLHVDGGDPRNGLDAARLLAERQPGTHVYCCGPVGLIAAVRAAASHWPADSVHLESFAAPALPLAAMPGDAEFEVEIASTGEVVPVRADQSILDALRTRGYACDSSCEAGTCGVCRTGLLEGEADHQDFVLTDEEQADWMMVCVSRAKAGRLKLAL